jgi:hypothetical protein
MGPSLLRGGPRAFVDGMVFTALLAFSTGDRSKERRVEEKGLEGAFECGRDVWRMGVKCWKVWKGGCVEWWVCRETKSRVQEEDRYRRCETAGSGPNSKRT